MDSRWKSPEHRDDAIKFNFQVFFRRELIHGYHEPTLFGNADQDRTFKLADISILAHFAICKLPFGHFDFIYAKIS